MSALPAGELPSDTSNVSDGQQVHDADEFRITDLFVGNGHSFAMLTDEELAKAMPLCADTSLAGSRHWLRAEQTPIDPAVLAAAIREYEARS